MHHVDSIILNGSFFFVRLTWHSFCTKFHLFRNEKCIYWCKKMRFFIVYTSLLDQKVYKSIVLSQWFCLGSLLYCYLQWICMCAKMRRADSQLFLGFSAWFGIIFHDNCTASDRVASTWMWTSQRTLTSPPHPMTQALSIGELWSPRYL